MDLKVENLKELKEFLREKAFLAIAKIAATAPVQVPNSQGLERLREALTQPVKGVLEKAFKTFFIESKRILKTN